MNGSKIMIVALVFALVISNVGWALKTIDQGVSYTYLADSFGASEQALTQTLAVVNTATRSTSRHETVRAARQASAHPQINPFEKAGYVWVGRLGLRFSATDQLIEVTVDG